MTARPRIAICGLHCECSTFTPHISTREEFRESEGQVLLDRYPFIGADAPEWSQQVEWVPIFHAGAVPGGPILPETYLTWKAMILERLSEAGHLDGIYFDIHGALTAVGMDDVEGDLARSIREVVGSEPLMGATMDLHGNVSEKLFDACDQMTCYRLAPHEDTWETRERAARNLATALLSGADKPEKALVHVPILLPGEKTSTRLEPAKSLYADLYRIEAEPGITDASIWIGYAWADQPRSKASVVVYGDNRAAVDEQAMAIAERLWAARDDFEFVAPAASFEECLAAALASPVKPYFISDSGDNPGAGGADDCTAALAGLLACEQIRSGEKTAVMASLVDPETVAKAVEVGVGNTATFHVGGKIDTREPGTVTMEATVGAIGEDLIGKTSVRLDAGGLQVLVTSQRTQYCEIGMYHVLDVDPSQKDIVCVKIGYLEPELFEAQADWMLALTPGGVDQDLIRLGHSKIDRPMYPFDDDFDPALEIRR